MLQDALSQQFGGAALATQTATAEKTKAAIEFWQEYVTFDWQTTQLPDGFADTVGNCGCKPWPCLRPRHERR
jgi:hypothetical protein